jgi:hypothetical protein
VAPPAAAANAARAWRPRRPHRLEHGFRRASVRRPASDRAAPRRRDGCPASVRWP